MTKFSGPTPESFSSTDPIEAEIQSKGLTAPRVTPNDIRANIASEHYFTAAQGDAKAVEDVAFAGGALNAAGRSTPEALRLLTFCVLVLKNGFTVTGEAACASPENFDAEIGRKIARENAVQKIWPLMGYALKERLHLQQDPASALRYALGADVEILESSKSVDVMESFIESIARTCHEVNRAYCAGLGDDSQVPWYEAPEEIKRSAINGVSYLLDHPDAGPQDSHRNWLAFKEAEGWKYGPVKDFDKKEHPCFVPYEDLPVEQRTKDALFHSVVRNAAL